jgi:hypothetical protein
MCPFTVWSFLIFVNYLAEQLRQTLIRANKKLVDTLLAALAPTPIAPTAVAIGSSGCIDLTQESEDDDCVITGSNETNRGRFNPTQHNGQAGPIYIPLPRRLRRITTATNDETNKSFLVKDGSGVTRNGEDRRRCLSALWSNPNARRTYHLIAWSWLRSLRPDLVVWTDPSNFITVRGPKDTNALRYDGSVIDDCVFLWHMTPQSAIQKLQLFYLSSIRLWHTRCHHHECTRVCSRLIPNWIIALGCGIAKSQQQWEDLIHGRVTISHLCHDRDCREPPHIVFRTRRVSPEYLLPG